VTNGNVPYVSVGAAGTTLILTKYDSSTHTGASFTDVNVHVTAGTVLDQGASYTTPVYGSNYTISVGGTGQYLADAAGVNVSNNIVFYDGGGTIGGAGANTTTFSGQEIVGYSNSAAMDLTAAAGGRVNFTGDIHNVSGDVNKTIAKIGAGTISLNDTQGRGEDQTGAWEIKNGTMLLNGTVAQGSSITGSGLEIDNVAHSSLSPNVQTYATLGGIGSTAVAVTADGANSSITPGDPTVNNGIGTLTLAGGLTASQGLTMNFTLNGTGPNSEIALAGSDLTLAGTVTFDFTNIGGALNLNTPYTLITGIANAGQLGTALTNRANTFVFDGPAGYRVSSYSIGGDANPNDSSFYVEFAVPEPSVYGMLGLGLLALIGIRHFRRLS
jgi:hypothetical protein